MASFLCLALHLVSGTMHVVSPRPLTWRLGVPTTSASRQEEEAQSLKAWARKCPSVISVTFYWSRSHRARDRKSDKEFGAIFNMP